MFVVQIGHFAWLDANCVVTTSGAHALALASEETAGQFALRFDRDRAAAMEHCNPRQRGIFALAPVTVVPLAELQARLARNDRPSLRTPPVAAPGAATVPADGQPKAPKPAGITATILQWVRDNPQATRADALARFPDANRSTVGVQFGLARKTAN